MKWITRRMIFFRLLKKLLPTQKRGLVRLLALKGDLHEAERTLRRLIFFGGKSARPAAAGACLFLAESPAVPMGRRRRYLKSARLLLLCSRGTEERGTSGEDGTDLITALVEWRLGRGEASLRRLEGAAAKGGEEAYFLHLREQCELYSGNPSPEYRKRLFELISRYKKLRPFGRASLCS